VPGTTLPSARASRRRVLTYAVAAAGTAAFLTPGTAAANAPDRELAFLNVHTGERLNATYWQRGHFLVDGLAEIDHLLRDFRTDDIKAIDTRLLDLLHAVNQKLDNPRPLHVISGYRSPETNAMLAARSSRVAKNSYHMKGMAIDVRVPEQDLRRLRAAGMALGRGGVGYYPESNFVHLDTGPARHW
jgi:uncharacterized protein YcbK (DUF882 family)